MFKSSGRHDSPLPSSFPTRRSSDLLCLVFLIHKKYVSNILAVPNTRLKAFITFIKIENEIHEHKPISNWLTASCQLIQFVWFRSGWTDYYNVKYVGNNGIHVDSTNMDEILLTNLTAIHHHIWEYWDWMFNNWSHSPKTSKIRYNIYIRCVFPWHNISSIIVVTLLPSEDTLTSMSKEQMFSCLTFIVSFTNLIIHFFIYSFST